ncbi:MAG: lysozyme inhibitor LprI family protein [Candidatus Acidiferrales bacterium]
MPRSLLAVIFVVALASASSFAQPGARSPSQAEQANPCDAAKTQMEMNECSAEEYKRADAHLNAVYANLVRLLQKESGHPQQQNGKEQRKPETFAVDKLKAAQRQWIRYRDIHCSAVRAQYEGGTISPMMWTTCMTETTDHRIEELKHGYESGDVKLD